MRLFIIDPLLLSDMIPEIAVRHGETMRRLVRKSPWLADIDEAATADILGRTYLMYSVGKFS